MTFAFPLYHYTCSHGAAGINRDGRVRPGRELKPGMPLQSSFAWFTDLDAPNLDALGLDSIILGCDRTEHRFQVADDTKVFPWHALRRKLPRQMVGPLEASPGALPMHWFVAAEPIPILVARLDRRSRLQRTVRTMRR